MVKQHKQYLVTQAICIEMFGGDPSWRDDMTRKGMIEVSEDKRVMATKKWTSSYTDPVTGRLYM